jgi:type IV secretory pathway TraG/TraD family ATPase VirD4
MLQVFGANDHGSTHLLSSLLGQKMGQKTVVLQTLSQALDAHKSGLPFGPAPCRRPDAQPDKMRRLPDRAALLFLARQRPVFVRKLRYLDKPQFRGWFIRPEKMD